MTQDNADERRVEKKVVFLQGLEGFVTEMALTNSGTKPDEIIILFKENFNRSMLANSDYHFQMAELHKKNGDEALSALHKLQAEMYKTISAK